MTTTMKLGLYWEEVNQENEDILGLNPPKWEFTVMYFTNKHMG